MKIAIFHELQQLSGARKMVEEYGKILSKNNTIDLYYIDENKDSNTEKLFTNVFYTSFKLRKWSGNNWKSKIYKDTVELVKLYFLHKSIAEKINKEKYDFVLVNPSKLTQAPFILRFLEGKTFYFSQEALRLVYDDLFSLKANLNMFKKVYEKLNRSIRKRIDRINISKASLVLTNSEFTRQNILKAYDIDSRVCYLGVDENKYRQLNLKKKYDIFFLGEKTEFDGHDLFLKALKLFKEKPSVKFLTRDKNPISEEELINEYNRSKIAVAMSRSEPFGLAAIEAMSCELPVVALNEGCFKETVENNTTGFLVDINANKIKEKIDRLLREENVREKFGADARTHILKNFTWKESVRNFLKIVNSSYNKTK